LDKYHVKLLPKAYRDLDSIYEYIAINFQANQTALNLIGKLEESILSLEITPQRGPKRRVGAYANKEYRQLFINNFTIVYRIDEDNNQVIIVTVRYSKSEF